MSVFVGPSRTLDCSLIFQPDSGKGIGWQLEVPENCYDVYIRGFLPNSDGLFMGSIWAFWFAWDGFGPLGFFSRFS